MGAHPSHRGFTLIELMIVVAIVGVLAAIAMPAYNLFVAKSQVAEAFELASGLKAKIADHYAETGTWPANGQAGIPPAASITGRYVSTVSVSAVDGSTTVTMRSVNVADGLLGQTITFTPVVSGGSITSTHWRCTSTIRQMFLPVTVCSGS